MIRQISSRLLEECLANKQKAKALALSFAVKAMFQSSRINNFTYKKVANMFGISRERAKSSVGILLEMGVCRIDGPHLTMTSLNRHEYGNKNLPIQSYNNTNITNLKEVEKFLRLQAVYFRMYA